VCANSDRRPLRKPAHVTRGDFLEIGHFAPFPQFLHIKGQNFPDVFIRLRLPMTPMNHKKFHGNRSARLRNPEDRQSHRQTDAATLYIKTSGYPAEGLPHTSRRAFGASVLAPSAFAPQRLGSV